MKKKIILLLFLFISTGCQRNIRTGGIQRLKDVILTRDIIWQGNVEIEGLVRVKEGVTLTILPGTKIFFKKIYTDNDTVGDSELNIEGKLNAIGAVDAPIIFTSAEEEKQRADWKFVYLSFNQGSELLYCRFEYAFTGLQVHYSHVNINHCLFENNVEGMRYSTVKLILENSTFRHNIYGLRYEERDSNAIVRNNDFTENEFGIFSVMRSDDKTRFQNNNIYNNLKYNFILGQEQSGNIDVSQNFWGQGGEAEIISGIFDGRKEETLGIVKFAPYLRKKVSPSGWKE